MANGHQKLAPSSASRWAGQCPGSVPLEAQYPQLAQDPDAAEGDAAHWVVAVLLHGNQAPPVGAIAPNGVVVDDEMLEAAEMMADDVLTRAAGAVLHIEEFVGCPSVHPDNGGTPDVWWVSAATGGWILHVYDFKYGHRFVDAWENWQCLDYASGILDTHLRGYDRNKITLEINVVQPRNYHPSGPIRRWTIECGDTQFGTYEKQLFERAHAALANDPWVLVGPACRDCRGRHACQALQIAADGVADQARELTVAELPPAALGAHLRMLERAEAILDARLTGLREQAEILIRAGQRVPFYTVKQAVGRLKWSKPIEEVAILGDALGLRLTKPAVITPTQAKKLGLTSEIIAAYAENPPGEFKLTQVTQDDARKVFTK